MTSLPPHPAAGGYPRFRRRITHFLVIALSLVVPVAAVADQLTVRVLDPATGQPLAGAFVLVGPAPDSPFPGNSGTTAPDGTILFSHPALVGPQMVTAGLAGRAYVTITAAPLALVTLELPAQSVPDTLPDPVARVTGRGLNIATQSNDSRLDIGFVLPALDLSTVLGSGGALPFEVPPDTVNFPPPVNTQIVPGIMTMPPQIEFFIFTFQKPIYKIDLADQTTHSLFCLSGRIAIADLGTISGDDVFALLNAFEMREIGIERNRSITNGAVIDVDVDLNLSRTLVLNFGNVPPGNQINGASAARIPVPGGGERYVLYDGKNTTFGPATSLTLAGLNPAGDLGDAVNAVVATHNDTSTVNPSLSAIVKRDGFTVPATLTMNTFLLPPVIGQADWTFTFTDATNPGISPAPTWSQSVFSLTAAPGATGVEGATRWIVHAPASDLGFTLPELPLSAPPGLPNPAATPEDDRLELTVEVNNTSGDAQAVLHDPFGDATHLTSRSTDVLFPTTSTPAIGVAGVRAHLGRAHPNPFNPAVSLPLTAESDGQVTVLVHAPSGRCVRRLTGSARAGKTMTLHWDGRDENGVRQGSGIYLVRVLDARGEEAKVVLLK